MPSWKLRKVEINKTGKISLSIKCDSHFINKICDRTIKQIASDLTGYEELEVDEHEDMHIRFPHLLEYTIRVLTKASLLAKGMRPKFH